MSTSFNYLLVALVVIMASSIAMAASKRQADHWVYYHFDGKGFVAGPAVAGSSFLAVRNGMRPVVLAETTNIEATALPKGKGALAGICYMQSSGGKLAPEPAYIPYPRMPVRISSGDTIVATTESDDQGYFTAVLEAGRYTISAGPARTEVTVEKDNTVLVPLRAGKRMVD